MNDHLGITMGSEAVASLEQFIGELTEIVDFTVENHDDRTIFVEQRLVTVGKVDNGQAAVCKSHPGFRVKPSLVGTTMKLGLVHSLQQPLVDRPLLPDIEYSCYSTHVLRTRLMAC